LGTDPHVGLWGVGWLPASIAGSYVRLRRGCDWTVRPLSARSASRLAATAGWSRIRIAPPEVTDGAASREAVRVYRLARRSSLGRALLRSFGPLWQLEAVREEAR
jgi:hypothetical protein